jgi:bifunctional non-homologous end joining protein LigD
MSRKRAGPAFTVEVPRPLPAERHGDAWWLEADGRRVRLSNLTKVFWPEEGYTKGDLLAYYYNVADLIVPYLADRPLTLKRMPNGVAADFFYEKEAPPTTPEWMPGCAVQSAGTGESRWGPVKHETINFLMVEDVASLLFVANLGCIEFHPLHSRCGSIERPDYLFFDLDPFEPATFEDVLIVARHIRVICERLGLEAYPKISGATGMQIYVPLVPEFTYTQVREFVGAIGHLIRKADPDRVTMEWEVRKRTGKVFVDHNMNRVGANIAAVYSMRPEPGATVSTPLTWDEVEAGDVRPAHFTIKTVWDRFASIEDPFRGVLENHQDISAALEALGVPRNDEMPDTASEPFRFGPDWAASKPPGPGVPKRRPSTGAASARRSDRERSEQGAIEGGAAPAPKARPRARGSKSEETIARSKDPKLGEYLKKRDLEGTPEPAGGPASETGNSFVIQKHDATRLHYDLRLENDGVLVSWAVPRGLPFERGDRRLAVHTEDHPMEYATFEGSIPEGHYGAGAVVIWDEGTYDLLEWTDKKVSFRLHGIRHRGEFHLVKTGREQDDWLVLLSKPPEGEAPPEPPPPMLPMLASAGEKPFDDPAWVFEPKLDGIRSLVYTTMDSTKLVSRTGRDQTASYPELRMIHNRVTSVNAVLDGEIVAVDERGRPSFERLQQRMNLQSPSEIERARKLIPVELYAFDLLWLDGEDLAARPQSERRQTLEELTVPGGKGLQLTVEVEEEGRNFYEQAKKFGFEGVMAKLASSRYHPGKRTKDWRKIKILNRQDCVILGWTPGQGGRGSMFGSLLVGAHRDGNLIWIGQVGTGFKEATMKDLMRRLTELETDGPPIDDPALKKVKGAHWVRPELVAEVEYLQMTKGGKLRAPSFKGLRTDKLPGDCVLEPPAPA